MRTGLAVACVVVVGGCGSGARRGPAAAVAASVVAQTRADTYAAVARRIYGEEVYGSPNSDAFHKIAPLAGLVDGLRSGDYAVARRALLHQPVRHAVRVRVARGRRTLVDVGLGFVVAGARRQLRAPDGRYLGRIEISIQDVIGFIKLVHRLTGAAIVVRGSFDHHVESSPPAAAAVTLPRSGPVVIGTRRYTVSAFGAAGFSGETLTSWILAPG
ncbi:MAG: hypothetical protein ACR2KV_13110 [Solirubrobacteraceae bacterium]